MDALTVFLLYLASGAATFPLTIMLVRSVVSVAAPARATPAFHQRLDNATGWSITVWILGVFVFYATAILMERQKPCEEQRTNQLTYECKKFLGAIK
ncbi:MAG: hypothetical protein FD144_267 [Rhodospirillaceae bacterium]|nr:MAG: hypothetical protein FD144_267 [Rhodospirillaceae bacterium]